MKICWFFLLLLLPGCKEPELAPVKYKDTEGYAVQQIPADSLSHSFLDFYEDKEKRFLIKTAGHDMDKNGSLISVDVFVELPRLDANSFQDLGLYFKDRSKVVCVMENSDGGNYIRLEGVDVNSFRRFRHSFGGWDKKHVYFRDIPLTGLRAGIIRVYSDVENCLNCTPYITDGVTIFQGDEQITDTHFVIPTNYRYIDSVRL